jgi:signal transduction histidine kinase
MIFRRISYRIAFQFTGFVFLLFMINGLVFFAADVQNARRSFDFRLKRSSSVIARSISGWPNIRAHQFPPHIRDRVRVLNIQGKPIYVGSFFAEIPFTSDDERSGMVIQGDDYSVFTTPIFRRGVPLGFLQVVEPERQPFNDIYARAILYVLISIAVSGLTFFIGLFFARRSLKPAEEMMERLEQFTQDASHELRTPLAALRSSLDLALKSGKMTEGIASAKDDVTDITELVDRLLELARLDQFSMKKLTMDLSVLTKNVIERHKALAEEKRITVTADIEEPVLRHGEDMLYRQLLTNLLGNALKFNEAGGTVTVTLRRAFLRVSDTGIGIPKEQQSQIFHRFYQADASRSNEGYGLGLALVRRIVDLHGWHLKLESDEGKGTTFTVYFSSKKS